MEALDPISSKILFRWKFKEDMDYAKYIQSKPDIQYKEKKLTNQYTDKSKTVITRITEESLSQRS